MAEMQRGPEQRQPTQEEAQRAEQILKAFVPREKRDDLRDLAESRDRAIGAAERAVEVGRDVDAKFGTSDRQERTRLGDKLRDLGQMLDSVGAAEFAGTDKRYFDPVSRIKSSLGEVQRSLEEGDIESARTQFSGAQQKMERLSSVLKDARNLAAAGAPEELISALDRSIDFTGTQHAERARLIDEAAVTFLDKRDTFLSDEGKHLLENLRGFARRVGDSRIEIDIMQERANLSGLRQSVDALDDQRRAQALIALEIQKALIQQLSLRTMQGQASELLGAIDDMIGKLKDKRRASKVKVEEIGKLATLILSFKSMVPIVEETADPQLRDDLSSAYSSALKLLSSGGSYRLFKLIILAAGQMRANPANAAYRKELLQSILELSKARTPAERADAEKRLIDLVIRGLSGELAQPRQKDPDLRKILDIYLQALLDKFIKRKSDDRTSLLHDACGLFFFFRERGRNEDASLAKELILGTGAQGLETSKLQFTILSMLGEIEIRGYSKVLQDQILNNLRAAFGFAKADPDRATILARAGSLLAAYAMLGGPSKGKVDLEYKELSALLRGLVKGAPIDKDSFDIIEAASSAFTREHQDEAIDRIAESIGKTPEIGEGDRAFIAGSLAMGKRLAGRGEFARVEELLKHIGFLQIVLAKKCPIGSKELKEMVGLLSADEFTAQSERRFGMLNEEISPKINDYLLIYSEVEDLEERMRAAKERFAEPAAILKTDVSKLLDFSRIGELRKELMSALNGGAPEKAEGILAQMGELFVSEIGTGMRKVELLNDLSTMSANVEGMQKGIDQYGVSLANTAKDLRSRGTREKAGDAKGVKKYSGATGMALVESGNLLDAIAVEMGQRRFDVSKLSAARSLIEKGDLENAGRMLEEYRKAELGAVQEAYSAFLKQKGAVEFLVGELLAAEQLNIGYAKYDRDLEKWPWQAFEALKSVRLRDYNRAQDEFAKGMQPLRSFLNGKIKGRPADISAITLSKQRRFAYAVELIPRKGADEAGLIEASAILSAYESMAANAIVSENRAEETLEVTTPGINAVSRMAIDVSQVLEKKEARDISRALFGELIRTLGLQHSALSAEDEINATSLVWSVSAFENSERVTGYLARGEYGLAKNSLRFILYTQTKSVQELAMEENQNHPLFGLVAERRAWLGEKRFELLELEKAFEGLEIKDRDTAWYVEHTLKNMNGNFDEINRMSALIVSRFWVSGEGALQKKIFDLSRVVIDLRVRQLRYLLEKCRAGEVHSDAEWKRMEYEFLQNELKGVKDESVSSAIRTSMEKFGAFSLDMALIKHIGEAEVKEIYGKMGRDVTDIIGSVVPGYGTVVSLARTGRVDAVTVVFDAVALIPFAGSLAKGTRALVIGARTFRAAGAGTRTLQRLARGYRAYAAERAIGLGEAMGLSGKAAKTLNYLETGSAIAGVGMGISYSGYAFATRGFNYETALGALQASLAPMAWGGYALASRRAPGAPPHWLFKERNPFLWMDGKVQGLKAKANADVIASAKARGYKGTDAELLERLRSLQRELAEGGRRRSEARAIAEKELAEAGGNIARARKKLGLGVAASRESLAIPQPIREAIDIIKGKGADLTMEDINNFGKAMDRHRGVMSDEQVQSIADQLSKELGVATLDIKRWRVRDLTDIDDTDAADKLRVPESTTMAEAVELTVDFARQARLATADMPDATRIYLWRDGFAVMAADGEMTSAGRIAGMRENGTAVGALVSRKSLGDEVYSTMSDLVQDAKIFAQSGNSGAPSSLAFYQKLAELVKNRRQSDPAFNEACSRVNKTLIAQGALKVDADGRVVKQDVLFVDTGFRTFPAILKAIVEAEHPGLVTARTFYHTVSAGYEFLPHMNVQGHGNSGIFVHEALGASASFIEKGAMDASGRITVTPAWPTNIRDTILYRILLNNAIRKKVRD